MDVKASPTSLDSSVKWQSALAMGESHGKAEPVTERLSASGLRGVPRSLTASQHQLRKECVEVLELVNAKVSQMQRDEARTIMLINHDLAKIQINPFSQGLE